MRAFVSWSRSAFKAQADISKRVAATERAIKLESTSILDVLVSTKTDREKVEAS